MSGDLTTSGRSFPQQGQVDWVALSSSTVNFSVAALARFSKAGVDIFTVQIGKALCCSFQLAPHVQDEMNGAIRKLKRYSVCKDLLWFGFGIKDIIQDLSETEEGLSLVALCSSLLTACSLDFAASVLRELCSSFRGPAMFMPSLSQWRALLTLSSGILMGSHFDNMMQGFHRLLRPHIDSTVSPGDAQSTAHVVKELALVQTGSTAFLTIEGGADCSWLAAFAECILCLDIALVSNKGQEIYRSRASKDALPQVTFLVACSADQYARVTDKALVLPNTHKLIRNDPDHHLIGVYRVRSSWSTVLRDAFGWHLDRDAEFWLTGPGSEYLPTFLYHCWSGPGSITSQWSTLFEKMHSLPVFSIYNGSEFISFAQSALPELKEPLKGEVKDYSHLKAFLDSTFMWDAKDSTRSDPESFPESLDTLSTACAIFLFLRILQACDIDEDVSPSARGMRRLREQFRFVVKKGNTPSTEPNMFQLESRPRHHSVSFIYQIFSGIESPIDVKGPARAGRGLVVYRAGIDDPTASLDKIARYRICRGYISYEHQHYDRILDFQAFSKYPKIGCQTCKTTSYNGRVTVETLIKEPAERQHLELGYQMTYISGPGKPKVAHIALESKIDEMSKLIRWVKCKDQDHDRLAADFERMAKTGLVDSIDYPNVSLESSALRDVINAFIEIDAKERDFLLIECKPQKGYAIVSVCKQEEFLPTCQLILANTTRAYASVYSLYTEYCRHCIFRDIASQLEVIMRNVNGGNANKAGMIEVIHRDGKSAMRWQVPVQSPSEEGEKFDLKA